MSGSACAAEVLPTRFAAAMDAIGGWEERPLVAIGLSGGADSLCLALLAAEWAHARGGAAVALIVDHGLRPAAALESHLAAAWAMAGGLCAVRFRLPPGRDSAAALRQRRLAALADAAAEKGALHLLLGQHRLDQAETVLMRARRGSGPRGLAAMAPVRAEGAVRLVRPLLDVSPREIRAFLADRHQAWIADPSNDGAGERAELRRAMGDGDGEGAAVAALAEASRLFRVRREAEAAAVAGLLAHAAVLGAGPVVLLDRAAMAAAAPWLRAAALAAVISGLVGRPHAPSPAQLASAGGRLLGAAGFSLGGVVAEPLRDNWRIRPERRAVVAVAERARVGYGAADPGTGTAWRRPVPDP